MIKLSCELQATTAVILLVVTQVGVMEAAKLETSFKGSVQYELIEEWRSYSGLGDAYTKA